MAFGKDAEQDDFIGALVMKYTTVEIITYLVQVDY